MSRTFAVNLSAFSPYPASSYSNPPYSFIVEPHPAAFVTIASNSGLSMASILRRACSRARSSRPACSCNAPQQALLLRDVYFNSVFRQNPNGGRLRFGKRHTRNASDQELYSAAPLASAGKTQPRSERELGLDPRRQRIQFLHSQELEHARRTRQQPQPRLLVEPHEARMSRQTCKRR